MGESRSPYRVLRRRVGDLKRAGCNDDHMTQETPARAVVRSARLGDAEALASLLGELGYPAEADEVRLRLSRLLARPDAGVLVAEDRGPAIAVAAYQLVEVLERSQPQCRITTLVVDAEHRQRGLARTLLRAIESIAREHECFRLEVTTRPWREPALGLYTAFGFEQRPHRLVKTLTA
jgi:ribosomal protein S18 acetylase RimI-like enzyme